MSVARDISQLPDWYPSRSLGTSLSALTDIPQQPSTLDPRCGVGLVHLCFVLS